MIKLICINNKCEYSYRVTESELTEYPQYHKTCLVCGSKMKISKESLEKIVSADVDTQVKDFINKWFNELGIEGTIEMIERHKNQEVCYRLYKAELERRGFKLKD